MPKLFTVQTHRLAFCHGKDQDFFETGCNNRRLAFPSGSPQRFQIGVFEETVDGDFWDMTDVSTVRMEIKKKRLKNTPPSPEDPAYISSSVSIENNTFTAEEWNAGTHHHPQALRGRADPAAEPF